MSDTAPRNLAQLMGVEIPAHSPRMSGIFEILNALDTSAWIPDFMSDNRSILEGYLREIPSPRVESAMRLFTDMDEIWHEHINTRLEFVRHADKCAAVERDPEIQVRYSEELLNYLKNTHEADEKVMTFLEQAYLFFGRSLTAGSVRLFACEIRRTRLWHTSKVVARLPWTAVYLKDYLWEVPVSAFLAETEANPVAVATARPDHPDCGICRDELTSDPTQEDADEEDIMPTDDTVPNVPQFVCPTCRQPAHSHCAISWFSNQQQMKQAALDEGGELEEDTRSTCAMCRGAVDDCRIIALYHLEIAREISWGESFARLNGKKANPTTAS